VSAPCEHAWTTNFHADGCHWYSWSYRCLCGATYNTRAERDPVADPYSLVWMDEQTMNEPCERCREILGGAKLRHTLTVILGDGTVEREEVNEYEQGEVA